MAWISLTDPKGGVVWLNAEQVMRVRPADAAIGPGRTAIDLAGGSQAVRETVDEVMRLLQAD